MCGPIRTFACLGLLLGFFPDPACSDSLPIVAGQIRSLDTARGRIVIAYPESPPLATRARLAVFAGTAPLGWADLVETDAAGATFDFLEALPLSSQRAAARVFVVPPDLPASLAGLWPSGSTLSAPLDSLGPGQTSAWIAAGQNHGVRVGDSWWLRIVGQPAARFDVLLCDDDLCFTTVVPLVANLRIDANAVVNLWPTPAERQAQRAASAVSFVKLTDNTPTVWLPTPRGVLCPAEPHVDFFRAGRYLGHGGIERQDARFSIASFYETTGGADSLPRVGDDAVIRTLADVARLRYTARIFELTPAGPLLNAGEADGLSAGQQGAVYRGDEVAFRVELQSVSRTYAVVRPVAIAASQPATAASGAQPGTRSAAVTASDAASGNSSPAVATSQPGPKNTAQPMVGGAQPAGESAAPIAELRIGDEVRFAPPPAPPTVIGTLTAVVNGSLFTAQVADTKPPLLEPLGLVDHSQVVGVAILLAADGQTAVGLIVPRTLTGSVRIDQQLTQDASPGHGR